MPHDTINLLLAESTSQRFHRGVHRTIRFCKKAVFPVESVMSTTISYRGTQ